MILDCDDVDATDDARDPDCCPPPPPPPWTTFFFVGGSIDGEADPPVDSLARFNDGKGPAADPPPPIASNFERRVGLEEEDVELEPAAFVEIPGPEI